MEQCWRTHIISRQFKATLTKIEWYWYKGRHLNNGTSNQKYMVSRFLINAPEKFYGERLLFVLNSTGTTEHPYVKKEKKTQQNCLPLFCTIKIQNLS